MTNLSSTELKRLHRTWRRETPGHLALAFDGVAGPFNVGALLRTGAAYRAEHAWFTEHATGPENPKVGKTALGSERFMVTKVLPTMAEIAIEARTLGYRVIGVELAAGAQPLHTMDLRGSVCFVLGHEDHGLSKTGFASVDELGFLPQLGKIGSLNVATAGSIAMYEWARQSWAGDDGPR